MKRSTGITLVTIIWIVLGLLLGASVSRGAALWAVPQSNVVSYVICTDTALTNLVRLEIGWFTSSNLFGVVTQSFQLQIHAGSNFTVNASNYFRVRADATDSTNALQWVHIDAASNAALSANQTLAALLYQPANPTLSNLADGLLRANGLQFSNINAGASSSLTSNSITLLTNVAVYTFNSGTGTNQIITLPDTGGIQDNQIWKIAHGSQGTNYLTLLTASATNAVGGLTNGFIVTPGWTGEIQKQGSNYNFIAGTPAIPIGATMDLYGNYAGVCATPASWFVECVGQTLSASDSPLNGVTLPGTNVFTRYMAASGLTGGADTHTHTGTTDNNVFGTTVDNNLDLGTTSVASDPHDHTFTTASSSSLPSYVSARRLIRIR